MDKFLDMPNLPRLNQDTENLSRLITSKNIEAVI